MTEWLPFELHTHTYHSDGKHSLAELAQSARGLGLKGIALTDHNTMTGLAERDQVRAESGIEIIRGLEWTTFFGHMLTLGIDSYVDWRNLSPFHLHRGIKEVHAQGGLVGVAHPFRVGSPMCTGCFWEFTVTDWDEVDYIEVWSGTFPSIRTNNARAYAMWTELLNRGHRIAATCGRDWHSSEPTNEPVAATFLEIRKGSPDIAQAALAALAKGTVSVSMGPLLLLKVRDPEGSEWGPGEAVRMQTRNSAEPLEICVGIDLTARSGYWELPEQILEVRLTGNQGEIATLKLSAVGTSEQRTNLGEFGRRKAPEDWPHHVVTATCPFQPQEAVWIRAELTGAFGGAWTMIAFTNAIYFDRKGMEGTPSD